MKEVYGIPYGYLGFYSREWILYTSKMVSNIHHLGGTVLGSSRGGFDRKQIVDALVAKGISQVYAIGGDGTHRGAQELFLGMWSTKVNVVIFCRN